MEKSLGALLAGYFDPALLVLDGDTLCVVDQNAAAEHLSGHALATVRGQPFATQIGVDAAQFRQRVAALYGESARREVVVAGLLRRPEGSTIAVEARLRVAQLDGNTAIAVFLQNATHQHLALDQLEMVIQGSALGFWDWDLEHETFVVNTRWLAMLGYREGELSLTPYNVRELVHPDDRDRMQAGLYGSIVKDDTFVVEFRCLHKNGGLVWMRATGGVVKRDPLSGQPLRACGTTQDITTEKRQALEREEFFKFFNMSSDLMMIGSMGGQLEKVNPATIQTMGYSEAELLTLPFTSWVHPDDRELTRTELQNQVRTGRTVNFENRCICKNGNEVWLSWHATYDPATNTSYASARNVTASKALQLALRRQQDLFTSLIENTEDVICHYDRELRHTYINPSASRIWNIPIDGFLGKTRRELGFPEALCNAWDNALGEVFRTGKPASLVFEAENRAGMAWIYWYAFPGLIEQGEVKSVFTTSRDITSVMRAEEELRKTNKLNSIGVLAGGIAHDFNNILTSLFGNIELAKEYLPADHRSHKLLEQADRAFQRARHLTTQLLTFAKGGDPVRQTVNLAAFIAEVVRFDLSGSNVKLVFNAADALSKAFVDQGQITQVFSNLVSNAVQAMPRGGTLYITLENAVVQADEIAGLARGKYLKAVVRDEGEGIDPAHIEKIFDPYFTTRQQGGGLGLATVYSIVTKHGGHIAVASTPGAGATFTLYLPASDSVPLAPGPVVPEAVPEAPRRLRVLLMDDEEMITDLSATYLEGKGFEVGTAVDGHEAILQYAAALDAGRRFDCVVMDLTIPGSMGGLEALAALQSLDPQVRAIVSSGYAVDPVMANFGEHGFKGRLSKPFRVADLEKEIRRVLAAG